MFGEGVELLLATLTNNDVSRICYIKKGADEQRYFYYQTNDVQKRLWIKLKMEEKCHLNFQLKIYPIQYIIFDKY